ncbi:MAG: hypothetical protein JNL34_07430 [Anaerolineae bacterium]|nr:hypothetical protein [Anaerolineae bacterium]
MLMAVLLVLAGCNLVREGDAPSPPPALEVSFQSPENMAQFRAGDEVTLLLLAEDSAGPGVARVELRVDDQPHQEGTPEVSDAVPVFTVAMRWKATSPGLHSLMATAYRADGTASTPATIVLEVVP